MRRLYALAFLAMLCAPAAALGREAKLVRYPHYHQGRVAFTYLGDIWTASEDGRDVRRVTVHKARDVYPA
jgi:tricorn protease